MTKLLYPCALMLFAVNLLAANIQYTYDAAGRLAKVDYGDGRTITYTYDAAGNLIKRERTGAATAAAPAGLPAVTFEANQGQFDPRYQFLARRGNFSVALSPEHADFTLPGSSLRLEWVGANPAAPATGLRPQPATTNYLSGSNAKNWRTGVPHFASVQYANLFPGVDVVYYGNPRQLEYDLIVHPGADPSQIRFRLPGAGPLTLAPNGDLLAQVDGHTILFQRPVLHQQVKGAKRPVSGEYVITDGTVAFRTGKYDPSLPLIIDPVFGDYTLAGGSADDFPTAAAEDAQGFLYVVGTTNSTDFPGILRAVQGTNAGSTDVFVMKLSANTKSLVWVTYLGGSGPDSAGGISVDRQGIVTISGTTASQNFPVSGDALQRTFGGGATDGFVARLNAKGERLLYSSYLGGSAADEVRSLAVDPAGNIYAAGVTASTNFPTRPGSFQEKHNGGTDGFLLKLNPGDPQAIYSTFLGGAAADSVQSVAIDAAGNAYLAGTTASPAFPTTTGVLQDKHNGATDGFLAKLNPAGAAVVYSTFLGGSAEDQILSLALNPAGAAFVSGVTTSRNLPMAGSVLNRQYLGGASDGFLLQLSPNANQLLAASYLGGNGEDSADAIAVRTEGTILVAVNGTSFQNEPSRMYAFSSDLGRELGIQTIGSACMGGGSRIVSLTHSSTRSLAIGWARATAECNAPQWLALPGDGGGKGEPVRMASNDRFNTGHAEMFVGASGTNSAPPAPELPAIRPAAQYKSTGSAGDPFSTLTGEHTDSFVDLRLGGVILLQFQRYYSTAMSTNDIASGLGVNWSHNFDLSIAAANGAASVTLEAGTKVAFRLVSGAWQMQPAQKSEYRLLESANDFKLADIALARILTFNKRGQLIRIEDRNGNALQVTPANAGPAEVADGLGRSLKFTYLGGLLAEVRDHSGRAVRFAYRGENLIAVTDVYNRVTRYEYAASGRLTRHLLPAGTPAYANTYDASGRVTEQADAEGRPTKVAYEANRVTAITDPLNAVTRHTHDANGDLVRVTDAAGEAIEMTYDASHRRTAIKDRLGASSSITYHAPTGRPAAATSVTGATTTTTYTAQTQAGFTFYNATKVDRPDGASVTYEYDSRGNPITITDRTGKAWKYTYNTQGLPLSLTSPGGAVSKWAYNSNGTLASLTAPTGEKTTFERDTLGRITKITHADGATRLFTYDAGDRLLSQTDENGKIIQYAIDQNDLPAARTDELGASESWSYNPQRRLAQATDRLGNKTSFAYNRNNLVSKVTDSAGTELEFVYDALHRITAVRDAIGPRVQYRYDKEGVPLSVTDALGRAWSFETDKLGRLTKSISPLGNTASRTYDAAGRLASTTNGLGEKSTFTYDPRGLLAAIQAPGDLKTTLTRNEFGAVTTLTEPSGAIWKNTFDLTGRLLSRTDPLDRSFRYTYDTRGRLAEIKLPGDLGSTALAYDPVGRLLSTRYSDGLELTYTRDAKGRLTAATGISLAYDANDRIVDSNGVLTERDPLGRIAAITYAADKTVRYAYNSRGQVTRITDWLGAETELTYDASGAVTAIKRPNAVVTEFTFDGDGRVASIEEKRDATLGSLRFTYNAAGRVIAEERNLPAVADPQTGTDEFTYDAASQWTGATYDAAGRLNSDPRRSIVWNVASRPATITTGEGTIALNFNARGDLTSRGKDGAATAYVVNYAMPHQVIALERTADADARYYVYLPNGKLLYSIDAASNARRFYHFDRLGSTTFLTADDGAVTDSYEITPYGETVAHVGPSENPFTYLGAWGVRQQDSNGLYLMRFRLYDATTARFLSRDPKLDPAPRAVNPYQYAVGNPVSFSDPKGLSAAPPQDNNFSNLGEFFRWLFSTPEGQQMMRDAERQEAEEARQKAEEEERERRRAEAERERIYKEAVEAQQRWMIRYAAARTQEVILWAMTGYGSFYYCDLDLNCASYSEMNRRQAQNAASAQAAQSEVYKAANAGILLERVKTKLVGLDAATLVGQDGGTLIGQDGGTLVGQDGSTLVGQDGSTLVGNDGSTLVGNDGSTLVGNDGASFQPN